MGNQDVKINLDLVPESQHLRLAGLFFAAMQEFFDNPENEAEFQNWNAEQSKKGGPS